MGVLETASRIIQLGGAPEHAPHVAALRSRFEARAGAFVPEDAWFEERSRAFWCDALTLGRFGRQVEGALTMVERAHLDSLERAHRGLFRAEGGRLIVDQLGGGEFVVSELDADSSTELDAASGQLFDGRLVGLDEPPVVALLPGAVFHPRHATPAIGRVLVSARAAGLSPDDTLDALLRMERTLRALARVTAAYAYRVDALGLLDRAGPVRGPPKALR
ncbi:MAG: hypothetical protein ABSC94_15230 [Polyangiaceae bacterium]|jgi:hypothetical protein